MEVQNPYEPDELRSSGDPYKSLFDATFGKVKSKFVVRIASISREKLLLASHQSQLDLIWEIFGELQGHNKQCFNEMWRTEGANIECAIIARTESLDGLMAALWSLENFQLRSCAIALRPALELSQWAAALCMDGALKAMDGPIKAQKKEIEKVAKAFGQAKFSYQLSRYTQHERFASFYFAFKEGVNVTHVNRSSDSLFDDVSFGFWILHFCLLHQVALFYVDSFFRMPLRDTKNLQAVQNLRAEFMANYEKALRELSQWMKGHHAILPLPLFEQMPS